MTHSADPRLLAGRARGPAFDTAVPRNGYLWWYLDALSDDGQHALTLIAFVGSVFSPYYAMARRLGRGDPQHYCGLNVALYGKSGKRWALTERGRHDLQRDADHLQIGPSSLQWRNGALHIDINEITSPWPARLQGQIRVTPGALPTDAFALDNAGRHRWQACAPQSRIEVNLSHPSLQWSGAAYLDSNSGDEPLEDGFDGWHWSRTHSAAGTQVSFALQPRDAAASALAVQFAPDNTTALIEPPPLHRLPASPLWRVGRCALLPGDAPAQVVSTFEDTPFYARSLLRQGTGAGARLSVHESLSLRRFASPLVQMLLPFRMPRWARSR
ncbi:MAG: carotenoid 1,2-hydratase [Proteobacteria bacterium]|nr:carotenoid 1,2-hydratase [Pseudomonadota bacterium]